MLILHKGIIHERAEDAPFMGALIIASSCHNNCPDCFNQHLKNKEVYCSTAADIIKEVRHNPFNKGIILAGLEWSEDPDGAVDIIREAKKHALEVILYTGLGERALYRRIPKLVLNGCYIKFGGYDSTEASDSYYSCGVKLASTNQYIRKVPL